MTENSDKKTEPSPDSIRVMKLDTQLKQFIKKADITVAQLARASGVSAKTIYNWLEGQAPRNIQQVKKVAKYFDITLDELVFGEPPKTKHKSIIEEYAENEIYAGKYEVILRRIIK